MLVCLFAGAVLKVEFQNAFRHGVYCGAVAKFLCAPEGGRFDSVEFVRIEIQVSGDDWRSWREKGLRYWFLNAYYLPLCYKEPNQNSGVTPTMKVSDGATSKRNDDGACVTSRVDLSDWMLAGIERGLRYHGYLDLIPEGTEDQAPSPPKRVRSLGT